MLIYKNMLAEHQVKLSPLLVCSNCVDADELPQYFQCFKSDGYGNTCSSKTDIERLLAIGAGFFPERMVIPRKIISTDNLGDVVACLTAGIKQNYSMGIRTVSDRPLFGGAKLPWELDIDSPDKVDFFVQNTFPAWVTSANRDNYRITNLILMHNPRGLGNKNDNHNQFVYRLIWDDYNSLHDFGSRLLMEMVTGTNKLRLLDKCMERPDRKIFRYEYFYKPTGFLDKTELQCDALEDPSDNGIRLFKIILGNINELIRDPSCQLIKRLQFFASIGLNIFEFQGFEDQEIKTPRSYLYGLRGCADETNTGLHP